MATNPSILTLMIGKSGSGKSATLRGMNPDDVALINVSGKPLPFKGGNRFASYNVDDPVRIIKAMKETKRPVIVLDDVGYVMTNQFMRGHSSIGAGNAQFQFYNAIADNFWNIVEAAKSLGNNKRVYFIMHEDMNDMGHVKPKSIGKLIDEKVCLEGMFTIVLRAMVKDGKHILRTQSDGFDVAKTPMGMFDEEEIDNDLQFVDKKICEYYEIEGGNTNA